MSQRPIETVTVTARSSGGRTVIGIDPWRAPVSQRTGAPIRFRLEGDEGTSLMLETSDSRWDSVMADRPNGRKTAPGGPPIQLRVRQSTKTGESCKYSVVIEIPDHGPIEIDPELFICD